ncbi:MAG TPA: ATP-binding protein, partial [Leptospiraceae bacterium]|nr:ATP-binding protein [Leptospiraceae bacterium]
PVLFAKVHRDVIARVKSTFNQNSDAYGQARSIEEELAEVPVLVLDDLGIKETTPFENQLIYDIIDSRYDYNRLTIITSNDPIDSFREITQGRVTSRLREMCREIHLDVADHRLRHAL